MRTSTRFPSSSPWWALALLSACVGGQSGDGAPYVDDGPGKGIDTGGEGALGGLCNYETEALTDLDSGDALGFSAQDLIDDYVGTIETTFAWQGSEQLTLAPESGTSALTLTFRYAGGEARIRRPVASNGTESGGATIDLGGPVGEIGTQGCATALEVDVELSVQSEGGALDETLPATLVATARNMVSFDVPIDHEALSGSLEVLATKPEGGVVKQVRINGVLSPLGSYGQIDGVLEYRTPGDSESTGSVSAVAVGGGGLFGSWPASDACTRDHGQPGLPVESDASLGTQSVQDVLDSLNGLFPRPLTWRTYERPAGGAEDVGPAPDLQEGPSMDPAAPDPAAPSEDPGAAPGSDGAADGGDPDLPSAIDSTTSITMTVQASGDGCARLPFSADARTWEVELPVTVSVTTEDGRWSADLVGTAGFTVGDPADDAAWVQVRMNGLTTATFGAQTGLTDIDLSDYDGAQLRLSIKQSGDEVSGQAEVSGERVPDCVTNPPKPMTDADGSTSSAGCAGVDHVPVLTGSF